jgi:hypothetical protein
VNYYPFSGIWRNVSVHVFSSHEGLERSHFELQQSQQNVGSRETLEDVSHHSRNLQSEMSEMKEESNGDSMKYKTTSGNFHRNNKGRGCVIERASVEKSLKRGVKSSKHLVSKEKCGIGEPDSSLYGERNEYVKCVQKYPGVRRTSSQYYTTIDEYFGKNYIKSDEKNHNTNDSAKKSGKVECTVSNHQQFVSENKFSVESMYLEKSNEVIKTCTSSTKKKEKVAKLSGSQHLSNLWMNVTRRVSEPSELRSKIHEKRRFSYGGEESTGFGISVDKESEMGLVRNDMNNRKYEKMFKNYTSELQKTGKQSHSYIGSADNGTRMLSGGDETFKARRKEGTKQVKRSPYCPKVEQAATQGTHTQEVTKMNPGEKVEMNNRKNEKKVLEKESLNCSKTEEQDGVQGASTESGTRANQKDKENVRKDESSHCMKRSRQAPDGSVTTEKSMKITTGRSETLNSGANVENTLKKSLRHFKTEEQQFVRSLSTEETKLNHGESEGVMKEKNERILKENQRCLKTGQQATLQFISVANATNVKPRGNEIMNTEKNKMEMLKESAHPSKNKEHAAVEDLAPERRIEMKPEGSEMVVCCKNEGNTLNEIPQILDTEEHTPVKDSSTEKATNIKPGRSKTVRMGKNEEKILKGAQNLKRGQQTAAQSISMDKATKMKSEMLNDGWKEETILKESPQELEIEEQDLVQSLSTGKTIKLKSGRRKKFKTVKNERIWKESRRCLKTGKQATSQIISIEKAMKIKPGGSEIVRKNKVKISKESPQRLKPGQQAAVHVVSAEKVHNNTASEMKQRGNELLVERRNAKICRREKKYHSFESSNGCKRAANDALFSEKQKRRNTSEGITNKNQFHTLELDLKLDKYKKKREIMLELFGEDPDELSESKFVSSPDGVCMKVLQEISPSIISAKIADPSEENVKFASSLEHGNRMKDNGSICQPRIFCKSERERNSSIKGALEHGNQHRRVGDHESHSLCPRSEVHEAGSQKLPHLIDSVQQNNHQQEHTSDSITDIAGIDIVQQNNEDQSSLTTHKSDIFQATPRTTAVRVGTLGKSDHQKCARPEGYYENELSITCPMKDGTGVVAQVDTQKQTELGHQKSSDIAHPSDMHLTGTIKEGENGEFYLIVDTKNIDTLFPSPENDHSDTTMKLLSVNCNILKDINGESNGHCINVKGVVHPEKCSENTSIPSDTAERVAEKRIPSPENTNMPSDTAERVAEKRIPSPENTNMPSDTAEKVSEKRIASPENTSMSSGTAERVAEKRIPSPENTNMPSDIAERVAEKRIPSPENTSMSSGTAERVSEKRIASPENTSMPSGTAERVAERIPSPENTNMPSDTAEKVSEKRISSPGNTSMPSDTAERVSEKRISSLGNTSMPSDAAERVPEKRIASPEANVKLCTAVIPEVPTLCLKVTGSVDKHISPVSHTICRGQNEPNNQHHAVEMSSVSEPSQGPVLLCKKSILDPSSHSQTFKMLTSVIKQTEVGIAVIDRPTSESNSVVRADCSKTSCNFPHSTEDLNQTQLCTTLQADISNREETTAAVDSSRPTMGSDQLQPEPFLPNSKSTNDKIQHGIDVPSSVALPRIRVRDPESLGITCRGKSFFKDMDTKLCELTEVTYVLLQDITRIIHRHRALCHLRGTLKDTEAALAKAEYATHHQIVKAKTFLDLYKYVERSFSHTSKDILIKRLSELNPGWTYTSEHLELCQKFCILVLRNSQMNVENLGSISSPATIMSVPLPQQILQQKSQQHSVGVPIASNVALNTNNQVIPLLQARVQIQPSIEANTNSEQHISDSIQNFPSAAALLCTSSSNERMTHTAGPATNPTYDINRGEMGSNLNPRHAQTVNIPQQVPNYNPAHTQNLQGRQVTRSNIISYKPQPARETERTTLAQSHVLNNPPEKGTVNRILLHSYGVKHTTPFIVPNVAVSHMNRSVVPGFTGSVPVPGSSYSLPNSLSHAYAPNLQVAPSYCTSNNVYHQNRAIQQGTLAYHLTKDALKNVGSSRTLYPSNQHTQQDMFVRTMNNNSSLYKPASNTVNQPYPRNKAIQQDALCQPMSNNLQNAFTLNASSRLYPGNEASKQRAFSEFVSYPSGALEQNVSSHYMNSVAVQRSAPNAPGRPYVPNQVINQGMFSQQLSNDVPSNTLTGGAGNVSLLELSALANGPTREVHGYTHPKGNNFYRWGSLPPPCVALSSSCTQLARHTQKRTSVQEHHAPAVQRNIGSYNGGPSGCPQRHQTLPVAAELQMQLCGKKQHVSHKGGSHGRRNSIDVASNNYSNGGINQNARGNHVSLDGGNAQNGSCGNSTVNNWFSDKENNQSRYLVNSAIDNTLSDSRNTWCEPASSVCGSRKAHSEPANNRLLERGKNQYLSASTVGSNSQFVVRENQGGPVPNRTANNSQSGGTNHIVSLANSLFDRRNNQSRRPLPNRAAGNNHCDKEGNQTGPVPISTSNRLTDKGNSWRVPPVPVNIPLSAAATYQTRLEGVHLHSNKPTQKSVSEIGHQNVNNITQKHVSGAANVASTENQNVNDKYGTHTISEAAPLEGLQLEINSNITESPASLPNSQIVLNGNQTIQASGNPSCLPGAYIQTTGISFTGHSAESLHIQDCEPLGTTHFPFCGTVSEPSDTPDPVQQSTESALRTENQRETSDRATSQTYQRTSNSNPGNQPGSDEVVDFGSDVQLKTESGGLGSDVTSKQSEVGHSRSDVQLEIGSHCLGSDVMSKQSEEQEITILTAEECIPMSKPERSRTSSLNTIPTYRVEEAGGSDNRRDADSEVQFVSTVFLIYGVCCCFVVSCIF